MPARDWTLRIEDMIEAIERIQKYTHGMTYEQFAADNKTIDAVVRNFEILGEAAHRVTTEIQKSHAAWADPREVTGNIVLSNSAGYITINF